MPAPLNFPDILAAGTDELGTIVRLSGDSLTLFLSLIQMSVNVGYWEGVESETDEDTRSALVAKAANEIMSSLCGLVVSTVWAGGQPGFLLCDGSVYNRADYPRLYDASAAVFRVSPDTFRVPDLRHKFVRGAWGDAGLVGGEDDVILTVDQIPPHSHTYTAPALLDLDLEGAGVPTPAAAINPLPQSTGLAGGNQAHNNLPSFGTLVYVVVAE